MVCREAHRKGGLREGGIGDGEIWVHGHGGNTRGSTCPGWSISYRAIYCWCTRGHERTGIEIERKEAKTPQILGLLVLSMYSGRDVLYLL